MEAARIHHHCTAGHTSLERSQSLRAAGNLERSAGDSRAIQDGVIDVLHCPAGGTSEKVCTYDRCGQCFGELELFYEKQGRDRKGASIHLANCRTKQWAQVSRLD